jgi:hypothetical protein
VGVAYTESMLLPADLQQKSRLIAFIAFAFVAPPSAGSVESLPQQA